MKKLLVALGLLMGLCLASTAANAGSKKDHSGMKDRSHNQNCSGKKNGNKCRSVKSVPEIDAAGAAIALALVAGIISIGRERRRKA